jgi:serine/threonine-protein kinase
MAPEIVGGWVDAPSPAVDLYALGIVAFEAFTGRVPFDSDDPDKIFNMHMHHEPPRMTDFVPDLPRGLDDLVHWCLQKERYARIPSASVFARRLGELRH